ncbi:MAG: LacI family transcriptional regulator [Bifidobacteriaceae bacterium]|jgi:LacI family transcriptional regulator|nr:LacI family transcriptional regulator [Bifidobacteriaceae bacterium]
MLADVAQAAGVSKATASKALNGRPEVNAATRRRVESVARELGFTPNLAAQSLAVGRTGIVGLLTSDLDGRFVLPILAGAQDTLGANELSVLLSDAHGDSIRELHQLRVLRGRRVDGLIVVGRSTDPRPSLGQSLGVPVVYCYAPSDDQGDLSLVPDNVGAGRTAADHLVSIGRNRIVHITGDPDYAAARDRAKGADARLDGEGITRLGDVLYGDWTQKWGRKGTAALLDRHPGVDAIIAGSDLIAVGALEVLRDRGARVPEDVAVIGFDNWTVLATNSRPELTTIDMNLEQLGREAAQRLFRAIDGSPGPAGVHALPCRLVIRGSTMAET